MKITALQEYGMRILLQLAVIGSDSKPIHIRMIAGREALSIDYVEKILTRLRKSGLVKSVRGPNGGYVLVRKSETISIGEAIMALTEKPIQLNHLKKDLCAQFPGSRTKCIHLGGCAIRQLWSMVIAQLYGSLNQIYLSDLLGSESIVQNRLARFMSRSEPIGFSLPKPSQLYPI